MLQSETTFDFKEFFTYEVPADPFYWVNFYIPDHLRTHMSTTRTSTVILDHFHASTTCINCPTDYPTDLLQGVQRSLATKEVVLPAWVHYVAFDLFTAKWQVCDSA